MDDFYQIGVILDNKAQWLFCRLGIEEEYSIETVSGSTVVFGSGENQIFWSPFEGFHVYEDFKLKDQFEKTINSLSWGSH